MNEVELRQVIQAVRGGDETAFDVLFNAYAADALRTACLITGNRASGEDVVQEAFVQAYLNIKKLKQPEQFRSWFYKIMTRIAWRGSSKEKRQIPVADIYETAEDHQKEGVLGDYMREEQSQALYEAIEGLPSKYKTVVVLYYFNGFTIGEIAKIVGALEGTVKSRLHTARKQLLMALKDQPFVQKGVVGYEHRS